eukprot:TRINITY_DN19476_c0_g1_i1.p1 TRINITY_DN19476_c0_g1~~TRINITY_DN19476_c0_g1_i1.p1  ORF type:complete len:171 (-),score=32.08 TRINITY_DN19476_c0_g1_i1:115-627(-)
MAITIGNALMYAGLLTGIVSVIEGLIYLYWHPPSFLLNFSSCYFEDPNDYTYWVDCNSTWANNWGFMSVQARWQPMLWGVFAAMMSSPGLLEVFGFPKNFLQYGIFLVLKGIFGDMGYCGKLGVANGFFSVGLGLVMMVAAGFHIKSDRMASFVRRGYQKEDAEDSGSDE